MSKGIDRDLAVALAVKELERATDKFGAFNSAHEGYAVILEELDEAWDEIKRNDNVGATEEMIQVAAMALRFLVDCGQLVREARERK